MVRFVYAHDIWFCASFPPRPPPLDYFFFNVMKSTPLRAWRRQSVAASLTAHEDMEVPETGAERDGKKRVVVVGGGWAGFGAAKALSEAGPYDVTLLDANPNPGGLSAGWRTEAGRSVEAGELDTGPTVKNYPHVAPCFFKQGLYWMRHFFRCYLESGRKGGDSITSLLPPSSGRGRKESNPIPF